ncbi:16S rRNA (cytidine(1402)-2'-O)-methyltransferase [Pararhizobium haloflavum]|uniref:16S rRNA (cytidine(1402)-2'-O)-methyltransferase n=1 Tax=Pararhizobium haloflavum TaxID=2037914 RepID=UPI000C17B9B1|nr:16S rRNA (cytidine(1402)-2'-O)-methyltransferase [Pararhizobium haloflavum]
MAESISNDDTDRPAEGSGQDQRAHFRIGRNAIPARPLEPALYLVSTPIGNLGDITLRALEVLAASDILACEDTRVSRVLLQRYGIERRPVAYHEHNAEASGAALLEALAAGRSVALISDAGTPLVSDPGFRLVGSAIEAGHAVIPIPGASAPLAALAASGLPTDAFFFAGFLPAKQKARRERIEAVGTIPGTIIFFESPHRLAATLADCAAVLGGGRGAVVCRELTKAFEDVRRGSLDALAAFYADAASVKGEIVLLIAPYEPPSASADEAEALLKDLSATMAPGQAATEAARITGLPRKTLYNRLLAMKKD